MLEIFSLKGKRALITGASRGLGYAIAEALAGSGAQSILHGRDLGALERAQGSFAQRGWACSTITCEMTMKAPCAAWRGACSSSTAASISW